MKNTSTIEKLTRERDEARAQLLDRDESLKEELNENLKLFDLLGLKTAEDFGNDTSTAALRSHILKIIKERDAALKACAEMRDALLPFGCETCNGTKTFVFECQGCLTGEDECTCDKQKPEPCPQCQQIDTVRELYARRERALAHARNLGL